MENGVQKDVHFQEQSAPTIAFRTSSMYSHTWLTWYIVSNKRCSQSQYLVGIMIRHRGVEVRIKNLIREKPLTQWCASLWEKAKTEDDHEEDCMSLRSRLGHSAIECQETRGLNNEEHSMLRLFKFSTESRTCIDFPWAYI